MYPVSDDREVARRLFFPLWISLEGKITVSTERGLTFPSGCLILTANRAGCAVRLTPTY
jgi:hypothetical protein